MGGIAGAMPCLDPARLNCGDAIEAISDARAI
jgi:hypothetical protein